ncbi:MAG TPA: trigger factor [Candidatus Woesebacteria bacterium]|nr:trigger factor [Candidatus Woesebacteria bacterium]
MKLTVKKIKNNTAQVEAILNSKEVDAQKEHAIDELIKDVTVKGFRQGKAPRSIAAEHVDPDKLSNHILGHILNEIIDISIKENKYRLLGRPVLENIDSKSTTGWKITISLPLYPEIKIQDYSKIVSATKVDKKDTEEKKIEKIYDNLLKSIQVDVPKPVIDEEVNYSLERIASQAKSLNLTLENYFKAVNKTLDEIKTEYAKKAEESIKLDLILLEIAKIEKIDTDIKELKKLAEVGGVPETQLGQLKSIMDRRKTVELLIKLC